MTTKTFPWKPAVVGAAVATSLLLAACGGTSTTPTQDSSSGQPTGASSNTADRLANATLLHTTVNNNSDVAVQVRTFNIDPADWEPGGNPDQFNNVNLGVNTFKRATLDAEANNTVSPFGLQFWKLDSGNKPAELLAQIELEILEDTDYLTCGLTIRGDLGAIPCGASRGFVQGNYVIQVSNMGNSSNIRFAKA